MILKQPLEGVVQVEFKKTDKKIDTKKLNPYCYRFIAPGNVPIFEPRHEKTYLCPIRTTKAQISLRIRTVWSVPLFSLPRSYNTSSCYIRNFKTLASLCLWAGRFESYLVANPEDRFSRDVAHFSSSICVNNENLHVSALKIAASIF